MKDKKTRNQIIISTIACCLFLSLIIFYYHIDKHITGIPFIILTLLVPVSFVFIIVDFIKAIISIFKNKQNLTISNFMPLIITAITLSYYFLSPYRLDSENMESRVVLRACYEGTQNQATIKFREDKTFELHSTGVFFSNNWFTGTYEKKADTLYLNYVKNKPASLGDTLVIENESLITIDKCKIDSGRRFINFYLGHCKGLN